MAHAAKMAELTDGLMRSIAGDRSQQQSYRRMRDQAAKTFRNTSHARTNQFDVQSRLSGLVEKFAVLNREDLSDALQSRLDELPKDSKWMPEILALLLELSDRPLEKTNVDDVESLSKETEEAEPSLTWAELMAEKDPEESDLWEDVERGYHSSEDDATVDGEADSDETVSTLATSVEEDPVALARLHVCQADDSMLDAFAPADNESLSPVSELTLIRDTLSMLHGLPTNLYESYEAHGIVLPRKCVLLATASQTTIENLITQLCEVGSGLNTLRRWTYSLQRITYLQSCQAATRSLLSTFGNQLSTIERQYLHPSNDMPVSIVEIRDKVEEICRPLLHLSRAVAETAKQTNASPFGLLDKLYDEICAVEMSGDPPSFEALTQVFVAGLKTYLRPLSNWIREGCSNVQDGQSLVVEADSDCDPGRLWYDRFALRKLSNGNICTPKFFRPLAQKVFAIGKSKAFLQALEDEHAAVEAATRDDADAAGSPQLFTFSTSLIPFSQLVENDLESWIADSSADKALLLQQKILYRHGLLQIVDDLDKVFCSHDGLQFQIFADTLFWRMEHQPKAWRHEFLLSELAHSTLNAGSSSSAEGFSVHAQDDPKVASAQSSIRQLGGITLETTFSWPIVNITQSKTSAIHSKTFAFLLQTYRAKCLLRDQILDLKSAVPQAMLNFRYRLITLIDLLHSHITNAAHLLHQSLRQDLAEAGDIDSMAAVWTTHMKQLENTLLLTDKVAPIKEAITTTLELSERFASLWPRLAKPPGEDGSETGSAALNSMRTEFDTSLSFLIAGVRGIGRASGNSTLEELAERLEWTAR